METPNPPVVRPHGAGVRGATLSRSSVLFEGRFGRIFRALPAAEFGDTEAQTFANLEELARQMMGHEDEAKDGPDPEESDIPAGYTYLGQFIDHDLTFDPASSLQRQNDPDALVDFRTPRFDLDCVYGRGPDDQPYLYEHVDGDRFRLAIGEPLSHAGSSPRLNDHPRFRGRALIGDPRNDENQIVAQLHPLFVKFHNRLIDDHPGLSFVEAQRQVRFHYQWIVLRDFLRRIVSRDVLVEYADWLVDPAAPVGDIRQLAGRLRFYHPKEDPFIPLEFSAAAYRFGHSMVRPGYRLNDDDESRLSIFNPAGGALDSLTGFQPVPAQHAIDWGRFLNLDSRGEGDPKRRTQLAYKIDTSLVDPLAHLPDSVALDVKSLAERNLKRGWRMRLPSGQAVARAMGIEPLKDEEILIIQGFDDPTPGADNQGCMEVKPITDVSSIFRDNCPLWVYVLAETVPEFAGTDPRCRDTDGRRLTRTPRTRRLGPVGGRIVAETFIGLLVNDSHSFLSQEPRWRPTVVGAGSPFDLAEFVRYALQLETPV